MKNLFVLLSIVLSTSRGCDSCKEDIKTSCTESNTLIIPKEIKDRFWFKDSSYWIYKDSVSGQLDSCWIFNSGNSISNVDKMRPASKGKCFEGVSYEFKSIFKNQYQIFINPSFSVIGTQFEDEYFEICMLSTYQSF